MTFEDDAASALWASAGGKIPEGWVVVRFESFLVGPKAIAVGVMYPGDHVSDGVPCIRVGDVQPGGTVGIPTMNISSKVHSQYARTEISGDELLITLVGNPGQCVIATPAMAGWNAARALAVARFESPDLRPYLKAVLESAPMKSIVLSMLNTTVQPTLNLKEIRTLPVPIPPNWSEAKSIGSFSELIESKIANNRALAADLEAMARAIFKSWFVDFDPVKAKMEGRAPSGMDADTAALFPDALVESELGLIPEGWESMPFEKAFDFTMGQSPPGSELNERGDGLPFFQGSADFNTVFPSFRVYCPTPRRTANEDDVLFSVRAPVGDCNIAKGECGIGRGLCAIRSKFASAGITYPWMKSITSDLQRASGEGVVFSSLSKAQLANCPVVVAPENVYKAADLILSPILQLMANLDEESISFESTRDTILPRLISGKLRTQAGEAEEDVADLSQETHE